MTHPPTKDLLQFLIDHLSDRFVQAILFLDETAALIQAGPLLLGAIIGFVLAAMPNFSIRIMNLICVFIIWAKPATPFFMTEPSYFGVSFFVGAIVAYLITDRIL
jgi:ABC-type amino acid transport system permease subunit